MRMILPPLKERRVVDRFLSAFFRKYKNLHFRKAIAALCRFYHLKNPKVEWFEYIDWGKTAGKTYENGQIYLVSILRIGKRAASTTPSGAGSIRFIMRWVIMFSGPMRKTRRTYLHRAWCAG